MSGGGVYGESDEPRGRGTRPTRLRSVESHSGSHRDGLRHVVRGRLVRGRLERDVLEQGGLGGREGAQPPFHALVGRIRHNDHELSFLPLCAILNGI